MHIHAARLIGLFTLIFCLVIKPAWSAKFEPGGDASLNCVIKMTGNIEPGDADKFRAFLEKLQSMGPKMVNGIDLTEVEDTGERVRICLDSPGGSLAEAIKMTDILLEWKYTSWVMFLGTAVAGNERCLAACAILFLAGGDYGVRAGPVYSEGNIGRIADRVLHARGELGFNSIALQLPERTYNSAEASNAFKVTLHNIETLVKRMKVLRMRVSLLQTILSTPSDQMYYINTIGDAAHWNIQIAGLPRVSKFSPANVMEACRKLSRQHTPEDGIAAPGVRFGEQDLHNLSLLTWIYAGGHWENSATKESFQHYGLSGEADLENYDAALQTFKSDDGKTISEIGCQGTYSPGMHDFGAKVSTSNGWTLNMPHYWMYPSETKFTDLLKLQNDDFTIPANTILVSQSTKLSSRCLVIIGETVVDDHPCEADAAKQLSADFNATLSLAFTWPSGNKTVIQKSWNSYLINGVRAEILSIRDFPSIDGMYQDMCLKNTNSSSIFCFSAK